MTNCNNCGNEIFFSDNVKSKSGKHIPLNADDSSHDCLNKYSNTNGNGNKPQQEVSIRVSQELDQLHKEAIGACRKYLGGLFDNMTEDKKIAVITHYESLLIQLRK